MSDVPVVTWDGCYDDGWKGRIVPEAFAHPAKMARGLLGCILDFGFEEGFWKKGDTVLDPFGGIGTTGIEGACRGLCVVCCELEPKFAALAEQNFALHRRTWETFGDPLPRIVCGDSRRLREVLGEMVVTAAMKSPPYQGAIPADGRKAGDLKIVQQVVEKYGRKYTDRSFPGQDYGVTEGQLGAMPSGSVEAVLSSPPWENSLAGGEGADAPHDTNDTLKAQYKERPVGADYQDVQKRKRAPDGTWPRQREDDFYANLGTQKGVSFWEAARDVLRECHAILRPGAVSAWVVKAFVRDRKLVDFPGDWARLLEATGFEVFLEVRASLVKEQTVTSLFAATVVTRKERKSFFRRLAEKKGSPRVDFEVVLFARRS